jgi:hypothetical protein
MIKIRKLSFPMPKKLLLSLLIGLFNHQTHAQDLKTPAQLIKMDDVVEATNIKTQDYIWKFVLYANPTTQTVNAKLLNPHPEYPQLNMRALSLAEQSTFATLQYSYNAKQAKDDERKASQQLSPRDAFSLDVKFIQGANYKRRPNMRRSQSYIGQICGSDLEQSESKALFTADSQQFTLEVTFNVAETGSPLKYTITPTISDTAFLQAFEQDLSRIRFYPFNNNGKPSSFLIRQPFTFQCPKLEKYQNSFQ